MGSVRQCEVKVQDGGVWGKSEVQSRAKVWSRARQNDQAEQTKSEFWGKNSLLFGVDTRILNTNDK